MSLPVFPSFGDCHLSAPSKDDTCAVFSKGEVNVENCQLCLNGVERSLSCGPTFTSVESRPAIRSVNWRRIATTRKRFAE